MGDIKKRDKYITDNLGAFSFSLLQDLNTLLVHLEKIGVEDHEFKDFVLRNISKNTKDYRRLAPSGEKHTYVPKCPNCNSILLIDKVNSCGGNQVGGKYKTQIRCSDVSCGYEEFRDKSIRELYDEFTLTRKIK